MEDNLHEDFQKKKVVVEQIQDQKDNAMIEVEKVKIHKKQIRDEVNKELQEAFQRKKEEDEIEMQKKQELIRQIREMEKIPISRTSGFDPTEVAGYGLLEEMSIAELRERLIYNKRLQE